MKTLGDELPIAVPEIVIDFRLTLAVANFWDHYSNCPACHCEQTALCPVGNTLNEFAAKLRDSLTAFDPHSGPEQSVNAYQAH